MRIMKYPVLFAACGSLLLGGCHSLPTRPQPLVKTELFFGNTKGSGGVVTEREWQAFLDREITPRFPDGLTIIDTHGQWRPRDGRLIREKTRLVMIVHPETAENRAKIETIRRIYEKRFGQELVLQVTTPVKAVFD